MFSKTSAVKISSGGDISFRDFDLGRSLPLISRSTLDNLAYDRRTLQSPPLKQAVPRLSSICIRIFTSAWNEERVLDALTDAHGVWVRPMLDAVEYVLRSCAGRKFAS